MITIRVWFTKTGEASYISLLDLQRVMQRALKRSGLPVWYTLGFNPHIYMTFAAPLSLGQESLAETVDFKSEAEGYDWDAAAPALSACLPRGIKVTRIAPAVLDAGDIACAAYMRATSFKLRFTRSSARRYCRYISCGLPPLSTGKMNSVSFSYFAIRCRNCGVSDTCNR